MPYKKGRRVKKRTHKEDPEALARALEQPKSIVFCRGHVGSHVNALMHEWRQSLLPFTTKKLKAVKRNKIKDFLDLSKLFQCNTVHAFSCSNSGTHMRVCKAPQGPTLTFRIESFKLRSDIVKETRKAASMVTDDKAFGTPPLLVFNKFNTSDKHLQLTMTTFQGMFPTIPVDTYKIADCHRVMLINYNREHDVIDIRHYGIIARSSGLSRAAKKLATKKIPKRLGEMESIEDLFLKGADYLSDTDAEGEELDLPQNYKRLESGTKTKIKLTEIGPRLTLTLMRIETGFWGGETIYHKLYEKTPEEIAETARQVKLRERLKQMRKKEQEANVKRKEEEKQKKKEEKEAKKAQKRKAGDDEEDDDEFEVVGNGAEDGDEDGDLEEQGLKREREDDNEEVSGDDADEEGGIPTKPKPSRKVWQRAKRKRVEKQAKRFA